jgi:pimeloyl-ACP methyl ester carboxylesterase
LLNHTIYKHPSSQQWVTFIHGAGGSSVIWYKQIRAFRQCFNVLLIDLRGHGRSTSRIYENLKKYSFSQIGDDVIKVLDHIGIRETHFIGISLGTIVIKELSLRFPERTKSLVLGGAIMYMNPHGRLLMRLGGVLQSILPYLILYKLFAFVIMPKKSHRESRSLFIREARKLYHKEFRRWYTLTAELNPLLRSFRRAESVHPILYIMGEQDHMFLPSIRKLVKYQPNASLLVISNSGHVVNVDSPVSFNKASIDFIERHIEGSQ